MILKLCRGVCINLSFFAHSHKRASDGHDQIQDNGPNKPGSMWCKDFCVSSRFLLEPTRFCKRCALILV